MPTVTKSKSTKAKSSESSTGSKNKVVRKSAGEDRSAAKTSKTVKKSQNVKSTAVKGKSATKSPEKPAKKETIREKGETVTARAGTAASAKAARGKNQKRPVNSAAKEKSAAAVKSPTSKTKSTATAQKAKATASTQRKGVIRKTEKVSVAAESAAAAKRGRQAKATSATQGETISRATKSAAHQVSKVSGMSKKDSGKNVDVPVKKAAKPSAAAKPTSKAKPKSPAAKTKAAVKKKVDAAAPVAAAKKAPAKAAKKPAVAATEKSAAVETKAAKTKKATTAKTKAPAKAAKKSTGRPISAKARAQLAIDNKVAAYAAHRPRPRLASGSSGGSLSAPVPAPVVKPAATNEPAVLSKTAGKSAAAQSGFKTGDYIVYPAHGVGQILAVERQDVAGFVLELFVINFLQDKMTLKVPMPKVLEGAIRKLSDEKIVGKALDTLSGRARIKRTMWSRRAQEYEAKINSGDLVTISEVVRDLYRSDTQPEQSYSERQLYEAALDRMAREVAVVKDLDALEAQRLMEDYLQKGRKRAAKAAEDAAEEAAAKEGESAEDIGKAA